MPTQIKLEECRNTDSDFEESKNYRICDFVDPCGYLSFPKRMQKSESERIWFGEM
jgi:hypothetical protein